MPGGAKKMNEFQARAVATLGGGIAESYPSPAHAERLRNARHEAGHAVLGWLLNIPVAYVEILPGGGGRCKFGAATSSNCERPLSDADLALGCLEVGGLEGQGLRAEYQRLEMLARELVIAHWVLIRDMAELLLCRQRLTGAEVSSFLDSAVAHYRRRKWIP